MPPGERRVSRLTSDIQASRASSTSGPPRPTASRQAAPPRRAGLPRAARRPRARRRAGSTGRAAGPARAVRRGGRRPAGRRARRSRRSRHPARARGSPRSAGRGSLRRAASPASTRCDQAVVEGLARGAEPGRLHRLDHLGPGQDVALDRVGRAASSPAATPPAQREALLPGERGGAGGADRTDLALGPAVVGGDRGRQGGADLGARRRARRAPRRGRRPGPGTGWRPRRHPVARRARPTRRRGTCWRRRHPRRPRPVRRSRRSSRQGRCPSDDVEERRAAATRRSCPLHDGVNHSRHGGTTPTQVSGPTCSQRVRSAGQRHQRDVAVGERLHLGAGDQPGWPVVLDGVVLAHELDREQVAAGGEQRPDAGDGTRRAAAGGGPAR